MASPDLKAALEAWATALGAENVRLNDVENPREGLRTFGKNADVPATLFPGSTDDVAQVLAIANEHGIGLHPVSRGRNWGLGSRAPNRDGDVILDLSRLNRISGFDPDDGLVHVEPGVTFRQLYEFVEASGCTSFFLPTIGGPVDASVLANALDRGDAVFCDRWKSVSDLTIVLADGSVAQTGFVPQSPLAGRGIPSAGPLLEGLFSQSNFGVVTGAWLRLEPLPNNISAWMVHVGSRDNLDGFVAAWRGLQRQGTLPDRSFILWNGIKFLARQGQRREHGEDAIERAQLDDWYCAGFVTGESPQILEARDKLVEGAIGSTITGAQRLAARSGAQWQPDARDIFATPRQTNLRTVYWRQEQVPDLEAADPDRDGCGLIWLCLALPLDGTAIREFSIWCRERLRQAGMDFNIGLEGASFRTALAYLTLSYERSAEKDIAALASYQDILEEAQSRGFEPYRLANGIAPVRIDIESGTAKIIEAIRQALDSNRTIASGKSQIL